MEAAAQHSDLRTNRHTPHSNRKPTSCISNRYNELLEFGVTYTKQTTGLHSNRYRYALPFARHSARNFEKIFTLDAQLQRRNEVTAQ